jgi:hypothetical protein
MDHRTRRPKPLTYQVSFDSEKVQEEEEGGRMTNVLDFAGAKWPIFVRILVLSRSGAFGGFPLFQNTQHLHHYLIVQVRGSVFAYARKARPSILS